ncbi:hypothetical protein DFJ73DRAFT_7199 [Zopfochytrium polystomum]|nr:hypothetical protein DFJ73DRAFT_7199 [Zopfochytrium polystomum]
MIIDVVACTLAVLKLAGGTSKPKFDETFAIAVVRTRVPFVVMRSYIASELVASHMWWCYRIDDTRQHVVAGLPSEPILAEAGACWMHHAVHLNPIFEKFSTSITAGFIDVGEGGETVAQLNLILGRDCAAVHLRKDVSPVKGEPPVVTSTVMRRQVNAEVREVDQVEKGDDRDPGFLAADSVLFSGAIGVLSFLEATFTAAAVGELRRASKRLAFLTGLPDPVEVGQISFTHFVPMFDRVTNMRDLATLFSRGAAVKCPPGCPGVDLIIPVLMPGRTGDYSLLAENMTFILVQVKNYQLRGQDQSYPDSATRHNSPQRCGLDTFPQHLYISLYMGLDLHPASYKVWHPGSNLENDFTAPEGLEKYAKLLQRLGEDDGTECQALRKEAQEIWRTHKRNTHTKRTKRKLASEVEDGEPSDGAQDGISECPDTHWVVDLADAVRKRRQIAISLLGLRDSLYICLEGKEVVLQCLMSVLRGPTNPLKTASVNDRAILARMMYPMSMEKVREVEEYVDEEALPSEIDLL